MELTATAFFHHTVDTNFAIAHHALGFRARVGQTAQLQELAQTDDLVGDGDVADRQILT